MAEFKGIKNRRLRRAAEYMTSPSRISALLVRIFTYVFLISMAFIFIFPFLYMIITSLKTNSDLYDLTVNWIPRTLQWKNYKLAFNALNIWDYKWNSIILTVFPTIGHIISCSLIGYGFARFEFPGKKVLNCNSCVYCPHTDNYCSAVYSVLKAWLAQLVFTDDCAVVFRLRS